ncbi:MAG: hypothetical protein QMO91_08425 [Candidatus Tisiphia sp.]|nr:hypothetical protein [Candidatus Tisiphia sp.]
MVLGGKETYFSDEISSNIDIPECIKVETTDSLKGVYSSANSSNSFTSSNVEPVELKVTDNNSLSSCYNSVVSKFSSFYHSITDRFSDIFSSTNASVSEEATFYVSLDSGEVQDKVDCSGEVLYLGAVSSVL